MKHSWRFAILFLALSATLSWADEPVQEKPQPFSFVDFSWMPGNYGPPESKLATKYFTPELRLDTAYHYEFTHPKDHTISGSSEVFRSNELQVTQIGVGGDFNYDNVQLRLMTQFGMYSTTTPRNDSTTSRGQWQMDNAYRYISEAYAGYHIDYMSGLNIQAGIFMSYVGLWSYYNFDNWTYQPSYVSSNTPWFFNGVRLQFFPSEHLKIEPWFVNGWQSYGMANEQPGVGVQVNYRPSGYFSILGNQYYGSDTLGTPGRHRVHSDDSVMVKYHDNPNSMISKAAFSFTFDAGCETGGVAPGQTIEANCNNQYFLGFMAYNRLWFLHDHFGLTVGGGAIRNPGRYLVLVPPINGANAYSGVANGNWYSSNPGDDFQAWDIQVTSDYMPTRNITFRLEYNHRQANIPYFAGGDGMTPPDANGVPVNQGAPGSDPGTGWSPDLSKWEDRVTAAMMIRL